MDAGTSASFKGSCRDIARPANLALVVLWVALLGIAGGLMWAANGDLEVPASVAR